MAKKSTNAADISAVTDPAEVQALANAEAIAEVIERYGMTEDDFKSLPEASQSALVTAHLAEKEAAQKEASLAEREARLTRAEEALTSADAGRFYDPAIDEGKTDEEKQTKYAGIIKTLLAGGAHPMFTIVASHNVEKNKTVKLVVDLPRSTRFQNRDEAVSLVAFTALAFANNADDRPEDDASLARGVALRQTV